ncbi:hypothetical protein [Thermoactinospora rubra]|uniref:hypothetical protein n=1 Tax=Thermoactinospora rubra TaxID=1088767 RepID=UPI000A11D96D|nr:hypothetical protein [Thermoactinospora rubra]
MLLIPARLLDADGPQPIIKEALETVGMAVVAHDGRGAGDAGLRWRAVPTGHPAPGPSRSLSWTCRE